MLEPAQSVRTKIEYVLIRDVVARTQARVCGVGVSESWQSNHRALLLPPHDRLFSSFFFYRDWFSHPIASYFH